MKNNILALAFFMIFSVARGTEAQQQIDLNPENNAVEISHKKTSKKNSIRITKEDSYQSPHRFFQNIPSPINPHSYDNNDPILSSTMPSMEEILEHDKKQKEMKFERELSGYYFMRKNPKYRDLIIDAYNIIKPIHNFYKNYFKPIRSDEVKYVFDRIRKADDKKTELKKQVKWLWRRHIKPFPIYENEKICVEVWPLNWEPVEGRIIIRLKGVF